MKIMATLILLFSVGSMAQESFSPPVIDMKAEIETEGEEKKLKGKWWVADFYIRSNRPEKAIDLLVDVIQTTEPNDKYRLNASCILLFKAIYSSPQYQDLKHHINLCPDNFHNERLGVIHLANRYMHLRDFNEAIDLLTQEIPTWDQVEKSDLEEGCGLLFSLLLMKDKHEKYKDRFLSCPKSQTDIWFATKDRKYISIIKQAPLMPRKAVENNITGYVLVEYDIKKNGRPKNIEIIESTNEIFNKEAYKSVKKYRYLPSIKDGEKVVSQGVKVKISFEIDG